VGFRVFSGQYRAVCHLWRHFPYAHHGVKNMTVQLDMVKGLIGSNGSPLGIVLDGILYLPYSNANTGLAMQDSAGNIWLLQIDTSGRLSTTQVTF